MGCIFDDDDDDDDAADNDHDDDHRHPHNHDNDNDDLGIRRLFSVFVRKQDAVIIEGKEKLDVIDFI